jgi:DNA-binding protein YbaB
MFDKLKQLRQIKELQDSIKQEKIEIEKGGVKIVMNGSFEVEEVYLSPELEKAGQERILKECLNEAIKKVQLTIAQKFSGMV